MLMGDRLERFLLLTEGSLAAEIIDPQGRVLKVETLKAGEMLAGPILFTADPRLPVQLTPLEPAVIHSLPKSEMRQLLSSYPPVLENFLGEAGDKVLFLAEKMRLLRFASIREKLAGHFLELARRTQAGLPVAEVPRPSVQSPPPSCRRCRVQLSYSLEDLADLFGVTRPALSRTLSELVSEQLVERCGQGRYLVDCEGLQAVLEAIE